MIFADFGKALGQLGDPRFNRVLLLGLALTVALLFLVYGGFLALIALVLPDPLTLPFVGPVTWVADLLTWGSILMMLVLSVFLMVPVASAITSMFLDDVADAVEARHYPWLDPAPRLGLATQISDTLRYFALILVANLFALILYAMLPVAIPFIFVALNGFLLGREYFQLVALRRLGRDGARVMARRHRGQIWLAGMLMTVPLSVPLLNLLIPVLGAATFTHLFHRLARSAGPG
jgi:uncharacterized protein involved in cysteine biosynthesis